MSDASGIHRGRTLLALFLALSLLFAGCLGGQQTAEPEVQPSSDVGRDTEDLDRLWNGSDEQLLVDIHNEVPAQEADVVCVFGGGPLLPRTGGQVLPGTSHLEVTVQISETRTWTQVGYTLDRSPEAHENDQDNITWLEPVEPGGERTFEVPVGPDQVEHPSEDPLWAFYARLNPGEEEACYTGFGFGAEDIVIKAIRGGA